MPSGSSHGRTAARELRLAVLVGLHRHRLLTTAQVRLMYAPKSSQRSVQRLLAQLEAKGEVGHARHRVYEPAVWYATERGAVAVRGLEPTLEDENSVTPEQAEGQRQVHTLEVNDSGIAFMAAARERGDECGPLSWRHEVWHWLQPPDGRFRGVGTSIDAVLRYTAMRPGLRVHTAFIELDRATIDAYHLVEQLAKYAQLHDATACWQPLYGSEFPQVLVIFAGNARASRERLEQRMAATVALASRHRRLMDLVRTGEMRVLLTLLEHLKSRGPFDRVWAPLAAPERLVGWLEDEPAGLRVVRDGGDQ